MAKVRALLQQYGFLMLIISVSLALFLFAAPCHLITTTDSLDYLSAAQSFGQEGSFKSPDGTDYAFWPPLFPMVIATLSFFSVSLKIFNMGLIVSIGLIIWTLSASFFSNKVYRLLWVSSVLWSVQFLMISVFIWSELLFLLLILINFLAFFKRKQWKFWMLLFMFSGFLLCLQRSAGFFWIAGMGWILAMDKPKEFKNWALSFLYCAVSVSGLLFWILLKSKTNDTGFNIWEFHFFIDFWPNIVKLLEVTGNFFIPIGAHSAWVWFPIFIVFLALRKFLKNAFRDLLWLVGFYALGYSLMQNLDSGEIDRYFSVIYPFFYLLILQLVVIISAHFNRPRLILILFLMWSIYPLSRTIINVERWHERSCTKTS